jgi:hypothetical protein
MSSALPRIECSSRFIAVLAAVILAGGSADGADDRFLSEAGRFRIAFPATPREESLDKAGNHHRVQADVDGVRYLVDWADLSVEAIRKAGDPEILLHRIRDELAAGKTVIAESARSVGESPGIELAVDDGKGGRRIYHIYKVGPRIYSVGVMGRVEKLHTQQPLVERYLESFGVRTAPPRKLGPLKVAAAEPRFGKLGPPRTDWRFPPYDVLTARLSLTGVATDDEGHLDLEATKEVLAADGMVVTREPYRLQGIGIDEIVTLDVRQQLPIAEGEYRLRMAIHDTRSGERTVWEQPFTRVPVRPALVAAALYRDADGKVPSPAFARVGDRLFLEVRFVGFARTGDRIDTALEVALFDEQNKPLLETPSTAALATADPAVVRENDVVTFMIAVPCPRVTKATLRATATDRVGGATATLSLPLEIHEPISFP